MYVIIIHAFVLLFYGEILTEFINKVYNRIHNMDILSFFTL